DWPPAPATAVPTSRAEPASPAPRSRTGWRTTTERTWPHCTPGSWPNTPTPAACASALEVPALADPARSIEFGHRKHLLCQVHALQAEAASFRKVHGR